MNVERVPVSVSPDSVTPRTGCALVPWMSMRLVSVEATSSVFSSSVPFG